MPKFTGRTDQKEVFELSSYILDAHWLETESHVSGVATLEVRTLYVASNSPIRITLKNRQGEGIDTFSGWVHQDLHRRRIHLNAKAAGGVFFEASLLDHGLTAQSGVLPVKPAVALQKLSWKDSKSGKELQTITRGQLTQMEAKVVGAGLKAEGSFTVYEVRSPTHLLKAIELPAKIENETMKLEWIFGHPDNPAAAYSSQANLERTSESYQAPQFYLEASYCGATLKSPTIPFKDWLELKVQDRSGQPIAEQDVTVVLPDHSEKKAKTDKRGVVVLQGIPPGETRVKPSHPKAKAAKEVKPKTKKERPPADEKPVAFPGPLTKPVKLLFPFKTRLPKHLNYCPPDSPEYKGGHRYFGADRKDKKGEKRLHAGCDLIYDAGTEIRAVAAGKVVEFRAFYHGTWNLVVDHGDYLVRYCEVAPKLPSGIRVGVSVDRGQVIAKVGLMTGKGHMLHFEMYAKTAAGELTQRDEGQFAAGSPFPFNRRGDLVNPTKHLDEADME